MSDILKSLAKDAMSEARGNIRESAEWAEYHEQPDHDDTDYEAEAACEMLHKMVLNTLGFIDFAIAEQQQQARYWKKRRESTKDVALSALYAKNEHGASEALSAVEALRNKIRKHYGLVDA